MALGDSNIIGDVTDTLVQLLADLTVTLDSPAELKGTSDYKKLTFTSIRSLKMLTQKISPG